MLNPILVFLSMAAWGVLHSWIAALSTKRLARGVFGKEIDRYCRLIFVVTAVLTMSPILAMVAFLPARLLWVIPSSWRMLTLSIQLFALVGILITALKTDLMAFAGIKQLRNSMAEKENALVIHQRPLPDRPPTDVLLQHPVVLVDLLCHRPGFSLHHYQHLLLSDRYHY